MTHQYKVIQSDIPNGLFEGQTVTPYYEDNNEIILHSGFDCDHHIKKSGSYFNQHLEAK